MWSEHSGDFRGESSGSLTLGQVLEELIRDDEDYVSGFDGYVTEDGEDVPVFDFAQAPGVDFVERCADRTSTRTSLGPSHEAEEAVQGALALRGWVRRPFRGEDDENDRYFALYEPDTVQGPILDAQALVLLAGEMAFRTYPGEHAFFDEDSEPARARIAAHIAECEWVWSTLADIYGNPGLDGRLVRDTASTWPGTWSGMLDHINRLMS